MAHQSFSNPDTLIEALKKMASNELTGALFISCVDSQQACVGYDAGRVIFLRAGSHTGIDALRVIAKYKSGQYRFIPGTPPKAMPLPDQATLFSQLEDQENKTKTLPSTSHVVSLDSQTQALIEQTFVGFVGPLAPMLCQQVFSTETERNAALEALAKKIPSSKTAEQFLRTVRLQLDRLAST